jgi:hypothetical protein
MRADRVLTVVLSTVVKKFMIKIVNRYVTARSTIKDQLKDLKKGHNNKKFKGTKLKCFIKISKRRQKCTYVFCT